MSMYHGHLHGGGGGRVGALLHHPWKIKKTPFSVLFATFLPVWGGLVFLVGDLTCPHGVHFFSLPPLQRKFLRAPMCTTHMCTTHMKNFSWVCLIIFLSKFNPLHPKQLAFVAFPEPRSLR